MKIMFLYPNHEGYFRCPIGLTLIMTILAKEGHEVKLFDTTFMAAEENIDSKMREKSGMVKPIPMDHFYNKHSEKEVIFLQRPLYPGLSSTSIKPRSAEML